MQAATIIHTISCIINQDMEPLVQQTKQKPANGLRTLI